MTVRPRRDRDHVSELIKAPMYETILSCVTNEPLCDRAVRRPRVTGWLQQVNRNTDELSIGDACGTCLQRITDRRDDREVKGPVAGEPEQTTDGEEPDPPRGDALGLEQVQDHHDGHDDCSAIAHDEVVREPLESLEVAYA